MTTASAGRLGGQYRVELITDDRYKVLGFLHNQWCTLWTGTNYEFATKLMDYCAGHDGQAQTAMQSLHFEGDPTALIQLIDDAAKDQDAKPRKRVSVVAFLDTDVLESENAITLVSQRLAAALGMAGVTVTQLNVHYSRDLMPDELRAQLDEIREELGRTQTAPHDIREVSARAEDNDNWGVSKTPASEPE